MTDERSVALMLATLVLDMGMITDKGLAARKLAREVLGIPEADGSEPVNAIVTNGTLRLIPFDEPVFLLRAQDMVSGDVVRDWANRAEANGAGAEIVDSAREHALKMDRWPVKHIPDLPIGEVTPIVHRKMVSRETKRRIWFEDFRPVINAIGEMSVQEAMDAIERDL